MNKKGILLWILLLGTILLNGCQTVEGAAKGVAFTIAGTANGVAKDSVNIWQAILKVDDWTKKNLW